MRNENQMFVYETIIRSECHRLKIFQNKIKKVCKSLALKMFVYETISKANVSVSSFNFSRF